MQVPDTPSEEAVEFAQQVAVAICNGLREFVGADRIHDAANSVATNIAESLAAKGGDPTYWRDYLLGAVDDHLFPPCDADFEYLCED